MIRYGLLRGHGVTDGNLNVFVFCLNIILVDRLINKNTVILFTTNKLCTVASLLLGAGGIQKPFNKTLTIFKLCTHVTC